MLCGEMCVGCGYGEKVGGTGKGGMNEKGMRGGA